MNPTKNDVTGDFIITGAANEAYRKGWDLIFRKEKEVPTDEQQKTTEKESDEE